MSGVDEMDDGFTPMMVSFTYKVNQQDDEVEEDGLSLGPAGSTQSASFDQVDAVRRIDTDVFRKYKEEPQFRMVSDSWGASTSSESLVRKDLLLYDIFGGEGDATEYVKGYKYRLVGNRLLTVFDTKNQREQFTQRSLLEYNSVIGAVRKESAYPCFVHITSEKQDRLRNDINIGVVERFRGPLFVNVTSRYGAQEAGRSDAPGFPRIIIQLKICANKIGRDIHKRMIEEMGKNGWTKQGRAQHKLENTQVFAHNHCTDVAFGVILDQNGPSSTFILNVSGEEAFRKCKQFYDDLFSKSGLQRPPDQFQVLEIVYSLNQRSNFVLRHDPDPEVVLCGTSNTAFLCFTTVKQEELTTEESGSISGWYRRTDPDGNIINVTAPLN